MRKAAVDIGDLNHTVFQKTKSNHHPPGYHTSGACEMNRVLETGTIQATGDQDNTPPTGDNSMMALWIALLFVSGFGVVTTTVIGKKKSSAK